LVRGIDMNYLGGPPLLQNAILKLSPGRRSEVRPVDIPQAALGRHPCCVRLVQVRPGGTERLWQVDALAPPCTAKPAGKPGRGGSRLRTREPLPNHPRPSRRWGPGPAGEHDDSLH
jgi:hypothetical protein